MKLFIHLPDQFIVVNFLVFLLRERVKQWMFDNAAQKDTMKKNVTISILWVSYNIESGNQKCDDISADLDKLENYI